MDGALPLRKSLEASPTADVALIAAVPAAASIEVYPDGRQRHLAAPTAASASPTACIPAAAVGARDRRKLMMGELERQRPKYHT